MATVKFTYKQPPEKVFAFLADPATARARSEAFGERDMQITQTGETVKNHRVVEADVPSFAKRILNPTNTVTEVKAWSSATKTSTLSVEIQGVPVKITGSIKLLPSGTGTEYVVDFSVSCKIPLIGGQLEKHITGVTEQGMQREFTWNQAQLDKL